MAKIKLKLVGKWSFLAGIVLALLVSLFPEVPYAALVLFLLGLIVGFLNISEKESGKFLLATITLMSVGLVSLTAVSVFGVIGSYLAMILANFVAFVSPVALVVAVKAIFEAGQN